MRKVGRAASRRYAGLLRARRPLGRIVAKAFVGRYFYNAGAFGLFVGQLTERGVPRREAERAWDAFALWRAVGRRACEERYGGDLLPLLDPHAEAARPYLRARHGERVWLYRGTRLPARRYGRDRDWDLLLGPSSWAEALLAEGDRLECEGCGGSGEDSEGRFCHTCGGSGDVPEDEGYILPEMWGMPPPPPSSVPSYYDNVRATPDWEATWWSEDPLVAARYGANVRGDAIRVDDVLSSWEVNPWLALARDRRWLVRGEYRGAREWFVLADGTWEETGVEGAERLQPPPPPGPALPDFARWPPSP